MKLSPPTLQAISSLLKPLSSETRGCNTHGPSYAINCFLINKSQISVFLPLLLLSPRTPKPARIEPEFLFSRYIHSRNHAYHFDKKQSTYLAIARRCVHNSISGNIFSGSNIFRTDSFNLIFKHIFIPMATIIRHVTIHFFHFLEMLCLFLFFEKIRLQ